MIEFMKIVDVKEQTAKAVSNVPEPVTREEVEALEANLRSRGIIDDKGLVHHGN